MKRKKENQPKPKEFAAKPFAALKGVQAAPAPPPPVEAKPVAGRAAAAEESDLFLEAMADVQRLHDSRRTEAAAKPASQPEKSRARRIDEDEHRVFLEALQQLHLDKTFVDELPDDEPAARPWPVNRMRQLRRGSIRIDYELDLHGLTRDEALEALAVFVSGAYKRGQQAVLVITGRGNHSPGEPVLQKVVLNWLHAAGQKMVAEFAVAPQQLGGDGAVVVFLRDREKVAAP